MEAVMFPTLTADLSFSPARRKRSAQAPAIVPIERYRKHVSRYAPVNHAPIKDAIRHVYSSKPIDLEAVLGVSTSLAGITTTNAALSRKGDLLLQRGKAGMAPVEAFELPWYAVRSFLLSLCSPAPLRGRLVLPDNDKHHIGRYAVDWYPDQSVCLLEYEVHQEVRSIWNSFHLFVPQLHKLLQHCAPPWHVVPVSLI